MKLGIVATGSICHKIAGSCQKKNIEVTAIYGRNHEKAQAFGEQYGIEHVYCDYDAFLQDESFDTAYIGLPNDLHCEFATKALKAGKHVIVDKPFASNLKELKAMEQCARANGHYILELDRVTAAANFEQLKYGLSQIGPVRNVNFNFCKTTRFYEAYKNGEKPWILTAEHSGGALYDLGVYGVNLITALFGMPVSLMYNASVNEEGTDSNGVLILKYADGMLATLTVAKDSCGRMGFSAQGEYGCLYIPNAISTMYPILLDTKDGTTDLSVVGAMDMSAETLAELGRIIDQHDEEGFNIRLAQSRKVMTIMQKARENAGIVFAADRR